MFIEWDENNRFTWSQLVTVIRIVDGEEVLTLNSVNMKQVQSLWKYITEWKLPDTKKFIFRRLRSHVMIFFYILFIYTVLSCLHSNYYIQNKQSRPCLTWSKPSLPSPATKNILYCKAWLVKEFTKDILIPVSMRHAVRTPVYLAYKS